VPADNNLLQLEVLRKNLKEFLRPEILSKLADLLESLGKDNDMLERYDYFCKHSENGPDCRYAQMAKDFFEQDMAKTVAGFINRLYHCWSKKYEE